MIDQLVDLLLGQRAPRLRHLQLLALRLAAHRAEHVLQARERALVDARLPAEHGHQRVRLVGDIDLHVAVVEPTVAQHRAELLARGVARGRRARLRRLAGSFREPAPRGAWQQQVEQALLRGVLRAAAHLEGLLVAHELDRDLHQVTDDRVDIATDVAHLGELARLDLQERCADQAREAPRDLGLPDAGRADHDDVLRRDLVAEVALDLLAAPAIAQGHGDGALGIALADDVAIELLDDPRRGERAGIEGVGHDASSSIVRFAFV